jgi:hypothetical protein
MKDGKMIKTIGMALSRGAGSVALKVAIVATAAIGGTALVSSSVFASLTATATGTTSVTSGTLSLSQASTSPSGGFSTAISAMAPGDTINRYVTLTNSGTLDAATLPTLGLSSSLSTLLTNDATRGLQISVNSCSVAWTQATGLCAGVAGVQVMSTKTALLLTGTAQTLTLPSNLSGAVSNLQISINLPVGLSENVANGGTPVITGGTGTIQGLNTTLTWTFTEAQRAGATSNS